MWPYLYPGIVGLFAGIPQPLGPPASFNPPLDRWPSFTRAWSRSLVCVGKGLAWYRARLYRPQGELRRAADATRMRHDRVIGCNSWHYVATVGYAFRLSEAYSTVSAVALSD